MENAAHAGISINDFWGMTPRELEIYIDAYVENLKLNHERMITYAYMGAYLQRAKRMPRLDKLLEDKNKKARTAEDMLEMIKGLNASFGGDTY